MGRKRKAGEAYGDAPRVSNAHQRPKPESHRRHGERRKPAKEGLVVSPRPDWHASHLADAPVLDTNATPPPPSLVDQLRQHAASLLQEENAKYSAQVLGKSSSNRFMTTIMSSGTVEDKVSALTLIVQESPLHTVKALEALVAMARKNNRNQALMALAAVKDLLGQGVVLPPDRKLRPFARQPGLTAALQGQVAEWNPGEKLPGDLQESQLIYWAYEDWLKHAYFDILKILESWSNDEVEYSRSRSINFIFELLKEKPEQEENLLRLLIHKLGDTERKVASRASYLLLQLQMSHPMIKEVVVNTVEAELLFRPSQKMHAKYYAITTLNQTVLSAREQKLANKLLEIYFQLFIYLLNQKDEHEHSKTKPHDTRKGEPKSRKQKPSAADGVTTGEQDLKERMIAQLLSGVNRAFPFSQTDDTSFEAHLDTIFRVAHSSNFNTSIQALILIQQISAAKQYTADRFYRTLYESLLDPRLITSSKQVMYLNLLYRSLKADISVKRIKAFVKRLMQIISLHEPPFVCGVLYLVHELRSSFPSVEAMLNQPEEGADAAEEHFVDWAEEADGSEHQPQAETTHDHPNTKYDGRKRDPEHSNADRSCAWEILPFQTHFHPTVAIYASKVLQSQKMQDKPDPTLHSLIHFLDRFVYRNAKAKAANRGISIMQPLAGSQAAGVLVKDRDAARQELPLNLDGFWRRKKEQVPADEVFFHQYFTQTAQSRKVKRDKSLRKSPASDESAGSEDEAEIWKALVGSGETIEGEDEDEELDDYDLDELMSDADDSADDLNGGVKLDSPKGDDASEVDQEIDVASDDEHELLDVESDDDALLSSDDDVPAHVDLPFTSFNDMDEEDQTETQGKQSRKKLKQLPVFASADDYAELLGDEE